MEVRISRESPVGSKCGALVVPLLESERVPALLRELDRALDGRIQSYLDAREFRGRSGELVGLPGAGSTARSVLLVGLGKESEVDAEALRCAAGLALRASAQRKAETVAIVLPALRRVPPERLAQALCEGALLGSYRFDSYRMLEDPPGAVTRVTLLAGDARHVAALRRGSRLGVVLAESANLARDLSNEPGSVHTPAWLAERARRLGREVGLQVRVLTERELERQKMGGLLAVGRGSANPPRLIVMEYGGARARGRRRPTVALVGKGITFDTGGISIKPADQMHLMKHDMSGAAAVFGALRGAAVLGLPLHLVGIVPAAENKPGADAYLPGDVVRSASGKTIEVLNTDAEGRIVLADGLHHARSFEPDAIVDIATLTGACVVALGTHCAGLIGNDERLIQRVREAGDRSRERAWPLPLWNEYKKQIKGDVGDLKNTSGREGGAITAGAFLSHFVGDTPWAHLDIAGTAWTTHDEPYCVKGATGFGVRLVLELLLHWR